MTAVFSFIWCYNITSCAHVTAVFSFTWCYYIILCAHVTVVFSFIVLIYKLIITSCSQTALLVPLHIAGAESYMFVAWLHTQHCHTDTCIVSISPWYYMVLSCIKWSSPVHIVKCLVGGGVLHIFCSMHKVPQYE